MVDGSMAFREVDDVPTIATLINEYRDRTGDSFRDMAARAEKAGYHVKHQTIAQLAKAPPKGWPKSTETISGLAVALGGVHERTIVISLAKSLGIDVGMSEMFHAAMPPSFATIDRENQLKIIAIVNDLASMLTSGRATDRSDAFDLAARRAQVELPDTGGQESAGEEDQRPDGR